METVSSAQLLHQIGKSVLEQRQLIRTIHGPGNIQQEHQVGSGGLRIVQRFRGQAQHQQHGIAVPGAAADLSGDAEGLARQRGLVVVAEIVDQLLGADGAGGDLVQAVTGPDHAA